MNRTCLQNVFLTKLICEKYFAKDKEMKMTSRAQF